MDPENREHSRMLLGELDRPPASIDGCPDREDPRHAAFARTRDGGVCVLERIQVRVRVDH
jgi:hypothetical protein